MKRTVSIASVLLLLLTVGVGGALAFTIDDLTDVQEWRYNGTYGSGVWKDVIGNSDTFNTFGADLTGSTLTIYTNWYPTKNGSVNALVKTADLFIDNGCDGDFDLAVHLDDDADKGKVYDNPSYNYAKDFFSSTGLIYGGKYDQANGQLTPVQVTSAANGATTDVDWTPGANTLNNKVKIDLTGLVSGPYCFYWGTATCSNDGFEGHVAPVPGSVLLMGSGLLGLVSLGIRKKKSTN